MSLAELMQSYLNQRNVNAIWHTGLMNGESGKIEAITYLKKAMHAGMDDAKDVLVASAKMWVETYNQELVRACIDTLIVDINEPSYALNSARNQLVGRLLWDKESFDYTAALLNERTFHGQAKKVDRYKEIAFATPYERKVLIDGTQDDEDIFLLGLNGHPELMWYALEKLAPLNKWMAMTLASRIEDDGIYQPTIKQLALVAMLVDDGAGYLDL
jgi:hypothetical protein